MDAPTLLGKGGTETPVLGALGAVPAGGALAPAGLDMAGQRGGLPLPLPLLLLNLASPAVLHLALGKGRAGRDALHGTGGEGGAPMVPWDSGMLCLQHAPLVCRGQNAAGAVWCLTGSRGGLTAPPLCEDEALQCRHPPGHWLGSDLCPSPRCYLTGCCLQQLRE